MHRLFTLINLPISRWTAPTGFRTGPARTWWTTLATTGLSLRHSGERMKLHLVNYCEKVKVNLMISNISILQMQIQTQLQVGSDDDHHRRQRPPPQNPAGKTDWRILCSFRGSFRQLFASLIFNLCLDLSSTINVHYFRFSSSLCRSPSSSTASLASTRTGSGGMRCSSTSYFSLEISFLCLWLFFSDGQDCWSRSHPPVHNRQSR